MLTLVVTDGEADDWMDFEPVLEKASAKRVFVVAIVGHGRKHDATLAAYRQAARKNAVRDKFGKTRRSGLVRLVTDPEEIALDVDWSVWARRSGFRCGCCCRALP